MLGHDAEELALLGFPTLAALMDRMEAEAAKPNGISAREMAKRNPDVPVEPWCVAGHELLKAKRVRQEWSPVPQPAMEAQESRYFTVTAET